MGTNNFITGKYKALNINQAYNAAREDAEDEYGHQQGYSGEINSTYRFIDVTQKFRKSNLSLPKFIDLELEYLSKGDCLGVCIKDPVKSKAKIKSKVFNNVVKGTQKWLLTYEVYSMQDGCIEVKDTKTEAIKAARKYTEETRNRCYIKMARNLESGKNLVAIIEYKPDPKESLGEYIFFGAASC